MAKLFRTSKRHDAVGSGHLGDGESLVPIENVTLNATVETGLETAKEDTDATETGSPSHDMESFQGSETDDDQYEAEIQELQIEERVSVLEKIFAELKAKICARAEVAVLCITKSGEVLNYPAFTDAKGKYAVAETMPESDWWDACLARPISSFHEHCTCLREGNAGVKTSKRHDAVGSGQLVDGESLVPIENVTLNATVETGLETAKEDSDATETGSPSHDTESFQGSETDDDQYEAEIQELQIEERVSVLKKIFAELKAKICARK
ncbi:hypothetical protein QYF36_012864 [Acer negundo]|nr:hypothetical protein QYF36_012864 [Acer negundo]